MHIILQNYAGVNQFLSTNTQMVMNHDIFSNIIINQRNNIMSII
jgi:hypothetical protein